MAAAIWCLVITVLIVAYLIWYNQLSDERKAELRDQRKAQETRKRVGKGQAAKVGHRNTISTVGKVGPGGLACPRCGSTQFTAKRSMKGKVAAGVLAPKTQVRWWPAGRCTSGGNEELSVRQGISCIAL